VVERRNCCHVEEGTFAICNNGVRKWKREKCPLLHVKKMNSGTIYFKPLEGLHYCKISFLYLHYYTCSNPPGIKQEADDNFVNNVRSFMPIILSTGIKINAVAFLQY